MKLALRPALAIVFSLFISIHPVCAQVGTVWQKTVLPSGHWSAVASSADGTKLVAGQVSYGPIYVSTDSGATWTPTTLSAYVGSGSGGHLIASSADGSKLAVATIGNLIYISHDSGGTWIPRANNHSWSGIASSADGTKLVAVTYTADSPGFIYTSIDSGTNWTARGSAQYWSDVASSADGTKLVAVTGGLGGPSGGIYTSVDSGTNWTARASSLFWLSVASSADGTKLVATEIYDSGGAIPGKIYTSKDSGTNWIVTPAPFLNWFSVASSSNGTNLVGVALNSPGYSLDPCAGVIYTSADSGASWQLGYAPDSDWVSVASSADGTKLIAANGTYTLLGGGVYTYAVPNTNAPTLNIATAGGNASLSWPWPSTGFVLQQNTNPASTNWLTMPGTPAVVNQMVAAQTNNQNFYRLVHP